MLIINNLQKLDPSHVPAQPVTTPSNNRAGVEKPVLDADSRFPRKKAQGVNRRQ
jgi:hypothetical protein